MSKSHIIYLSYSSWIITQTLIKIIGSEDGIQTHNLSIAIIVLPLTKTQTLVYKLGTFSQDNIRILLG